ncbi:MAG: helix-turn-helix domain-containing protein [Ilumatobacteraceae bacterium]
MQEYGQYCPVALGSEVLAERWTPLILREMVIGSTRFNEIERGLPGISRTMLVKRLRYLARKGVVQIVPTDGGRGHEYHLTDAGWDLQRVIMALGEWTVRWLFTEPLPQDVDPITLTWWMHRRVAPERAPAGRVVMRFDYADETPARLWIILDRGEPSVCTNAPGFDSDLVIATDSVSLMRVFSGVDDLATARANGTVRIDGPPRLVRQFPTWFLWSPFRQAVRDRVNLQ